MTKYINGTTFKPAAEVTQDEPELDIVSHLQLRLANGVTLNAVLLEYAQHLAGQLYDRVERIDETSPANEQFALGLTEAADQVQRGGE